MSSRDKCRHDEPLPTLMEFPRVTYLVSGRAKTRKNPSLLVLRACSCSNERGMLFSVLSSNFSWTGFILSSTILWFYHSKFSLSLWDKQSFPGMSEDINKAPFCPGLEDPSATGHRAWEIPPSAAVLVMSALQLCLGRWPYPPTTVLAL